MALTQDLLTGFSPRLPFSATEMTEEGGGTGV